METGIESDLLSGVLYVSLAVLSLAVLVAFGRVLKGPSLPDRVVAIDYVSYVTMGFLGTYAILSGREAYIDAALVLGLLAFIGTIALARYVEGRSETQQHAGAYGTGEFRSEGHVGGVRHREGGRPDQQVRVGGGQTRRARRRAEESAQPRSAEGRERGETSSTDDEADE
jgi:multicomponent Na+:H+ antiporter subunit F